MCTPMETGHGTPCNTVQHIVTLSRAARSPERRERRAQRSGRCWRQDLIRTYSDMDEHELRLSGRERLCVLATEVGGRWSGYAGRASCSHVCVVARHLLFATSCLQPHGLATVGLCILVGGVTAPSLRGQSGPRRFHVQRGFTRLRALVLG